jgi:adenine-specific DNA-methyltransferase
VAVFFGPQSDRHGCKWNSPARRRPPGFSGPVFAGFSFDAAAQAIIQKIPTPTSAVIWPTQPGLNMGNLLKETPGSQLFTVFGSPGLG